MAIPSLPVPPLEHTLAKHLESLPALDKTGQPSVLSRALPLALDFLKTDGPTLQAKLVDHASTRRNWIEDWWLDVSYLGYRESVVVNSNPAFTIVAPQNADEQKQTRRAARLAFGALDYVKRIDEETIPLEKGKDTPLCMLQVTRTFSHYRVPALPVDKLVRAQPGASRHIIVASEGQFFKVDVYHPTEKRVLTAVELEHQLELIQAHVHSLTSSNKQPLVGTLTSEHRDTWARLHQKLSQHPANIATLQTIGDALFIVCLDSDAPSSDDELLQSALHGRGSQFSSCNRWFDKLQFTVASNGQAHLNMEHSALDATPGLQMLESAVKLSRSALPDTAALAGLGRPQLLTWAPYADLAADIEAAKKNIDSIIAGHQVHQFNFTSFGRDLFKNLQLSPDASFQVALQLAYYRTHGHLCGTYETGHTRRFYHGRTETIRSASVPALKFAQSMDDTRATALEKAKLFRSAVAAHSDYTQMAMDGLGVDRHILGLKLIAKQHGLPLHPFLTDDTTKLATKWALSTSNCSMAINHCPTFGAVYEDGYGLCYNLKPHSFHAGITKFRSNALTNIEKFDANIRASLNDIRNVMQAASTTSKL